MNTRPATPSDIPGILSIERSSDTAAHWGEAEYRNVFSAGAVPRILLVVEDPQPIGFIVVRTIGPEWEIENFSVASDARRRGAGLALVEAVKTQALHRHAEAVILEVRASNQAARALYRRAGFDEAGVRRDYYAHPTEDAVLYRFAVKPA